MLKPLERYLSAPLSAQGAWLEQLNAVHRAFLLISYESKTLHFSTNLLVIAPTPDCGHCRSNAFIKANTIKEITDQKAAGLPMDIHSQDAHSPYIHHHIKVVVLSFYRTWLQVDIQGQHLMNSLGFPASVQVLVLGDGRPCLDDLAVLLLG